MSVRRSAGAIFWGMTLVVVGGLLLAHNMGYTVHVWPYVARYWPALLIAWGLLKFVDFFRFRRAGESRPLFSGGEVALLILVIFAGSMMTMAANVSPEIGNFLEIGPFDLWDITGNNFTYEQHLEQGAELPNAEIEIVNLYGNVEVRPAESDRIVVDVTKTVRALDRDEADRLEKDFTFSIQQEGSRFRIRSNREEGGVHTGPRQRFKSSLTIQVPKRSTIHLDNRNGHVQIQDLTGDQAILNRYGDVDIHGVVGKVEIENRNGSISIEDVTGNAILNNRYANTTARDIGGDLQINTKNGSVDVSRVKGNATIDNSYAPINVDTVGGALTITGRNNSVDVQHVEGDIHTDNSYQNVTIKDARGAVTMTGRNADMSLAFDRSPEKDITIDGRYANVTLELPSSSSFRIEAHTEHGETDSDFEGLSTNRSNQERTIQGEVGRGGPKVTITTKNGNIRLQKRG